MSRVHIDPEALRRLAKRPDVIRARDDVAHQLADQVDSQHIQVGDDNADGVGTLIDIPTEVYSDADSAAVVLAHPAGKAVQAKDGVLTKAASAAGLHVRGD